MVNPLGITKGTVYVQCGGCDAWHELVDNQRLVEEFDFRKIVDDSRR